MHRLLVVALLFAPAAARAVSWFDDDVQALPCRPTIACTADIVPPGSVEIELGYLFRKLRDPTVQHTVPFLAKLTLARWVQLQLSSNGPTLATNASGFMDDLIAGIKLHLTDQSSHMPSVAWSVALSSPVSSAPGFTRSYDLLLVAYVTKDLGPIHTDLNFGVNLWRLDGAPAASAMGRAGSLARATAQLHDHGRELLLRDAAPFATRDGGFLFALAFAPRPWIVLDVGADVGYFPAQRSVSAFAGLTFVPVRWWRKPSSPPTVTR